MSKILKKKKPNKKINEEKRESLLPLLPPELILVIFDFLPFGDKRKFKFVSRGFYNYYWSYLRKMGPKMMDYLNPSEHVFYTRGISPPKFYNFHRVSVNGKGQKYVQFLGEDEKKIRRLMKYTRDGIPYCRSPANDYYYSKVYKIDRLEMNHVGKSCCERCKNFDYCSTHIYWLCHLENCSIEFINHVHNLCVRCKYVNLNES
jgi:hypothetical protein